MILLSFTEYMILRFCVQKLISGGNESFSKAILFIYKCIAFERIFSDLPFWRSSRHKMTTFDAYVKKVKQKRKLASDYRNALLRTVLTRWHTSEVRLRNAVRRFEYRLQRNRYFIINKESVRQSSTKRFSPEELFSIRE